MAMDKKYMDVEDLDMYQKLCRLHIDVCDLSHEWPAEEKYELGSQARRSSNSAPAQLAEKHSDRHIKNKIEGVNRSRGEAAETIHHLSCSSSTCWPATDLSGHRPGSGGRTIRMGHGSSYEEKRLTSSSVSASRVHRAFARRVSPPCGELRWVERSRRLMSSSPRCFGRGPNHGPHGLLEKQAAESSLHPSREVSHGASPLRHRANADSVGQKGGCSVAPVTCRLILIVRITDAELDAFRRSFRKAPDACAEKSERSFGFLFLPGKRRL